MHSPSYEKSRNRTPPVIPVKGTAEARTLPCEWVHFPIGNLGVPEDKEAFLKLAEQTAEQLKRGDNVLVHCTDGVGRTGTFAGLS